jgi:hypothetical protein
MNNEEIKLCKNCINWLEYNNKMSCDYEYFLDVDKQTSILYTAEMMCCDGYYDELVEV